MTRSLQTIAELRLQSLFDSGRGFAFPCDPSGLVDLDQLSDRARSNYLYARAMVGRGNRTVVPAGCEICAKL